MRPPCRARLARTRKLIRAAVERHLSSEVGLTEAQVTRCFECVIEDAGPLDLREILASGPGARNPR